jgi:2-iminobutanoate/2-iminopropanoate deaminase
MEAAAMHVTDTASRRSVIGSFFASIAAAGAGLFGVAHAQTTDTSRKTSTDDQAPGAKPPLFSSWVAYGGLVFIAGKGEHGPGDITAHTTSVLNQLEAELKKAGSSMDKVLKVNVYLHDLRDFDAMNEVFRGRFGPNPPVRTTIASYGGVPGNSLVEIDCIAARG